MLGRRFLLLVAVLMGLTALAASVAPREPLIRERRAATPTPTPTATTEAAAPGAIRTVEKTISASSERPTRVVVEQGALVQLTVSGSVLDSVSLLDEIEPIDPQSPALFELLADTPGSYPIALVDAGRRIGTLVVRPAG
jgi:hypothetical protein